MKGQKRGGFVGHNVTTDQKKERTIRNGQDLGGKKGKILHLVRRAHYYQLMVVLCFVGTFGGKH